MKVECTNCGGGWGLWVAVVALVVALVALYIAVKQYGFSRTEHDAFLAELRGRARLRLTARFPQFADGVMRTQATVTIARLEVGIDNQGDRDARDVVVNVLVPRSVQAFWSGPHGEELEVQAMLAETDEKLTGSDGTEYDAHYLTKTIPRVARRPAYVLHVTFPVSDGQRVPIRLKAQSDDLPEDVDEVVEHTEIRHERPDAA